jgi:hypothetical protein
MTDHVERPTEADISAADERAQCIARDTARLFAEFTGWYPWHADDGRIFAARTATPTATEVAAGCQQIIVADTVDDLARLLREDLDKAVHRPMPRVLTPGPGCTR